jgi:NADPH-dependent 2,4-dienoyl-CoA reductase/sulfur reductase-like enzyme
VAGASLAGLRAVEAARRAGFAGRITLLGAEEHLPYDRPPLSKAFLARDCQLPDTMFRSPRFLRDELDVDVRLGQPATDLDPLGRAISAGGARLGFDALVLATGSTPRRLPAAPGLGGVHALRTVDDARAIRAALDTARRVVVVGAGLIGAEVASAARERGLDVTIVEAQPAPLERAVGAEMGSVLADLHRRNGVRLRCGVSVRGLHGNRSVQRVTLSDGTSLAADLVVAGIGSVPATGWLTGSGIALDRGVLCDATLATSAPGVYAAGDVARWPNPVFGEPMRLENWTSAAEQGAVAAVNAVGHGEPRPFATVPYFWSDWYGQRIQFVGVARADEIEVVTGDAAGDRFVALYRAGGLLTGALALNYPSHVMKYRALISRRATWPEALDFARERNLHALSAVNSGGSHHP